MRSINKEQAEEIMPKWLVVASFVVMLGANAAAVLLPLNGRSTADVSDLYGNPFTPAGITFSIWSVIYALLLGYCFYQFVRLRGTRHSIVKEGLLDRLEPYIVSNFLLNALWLVAWHYNLIGMSVLLMLGLLATLIRIRLLMGNEPYTVRDRWFVVAPFSVYFGWISVATIANITAWLVSVDWDGLGYTNGFWTAAVLLVGAAVCLGVLRRFGDWQYGAVFVWAYSGILLKHLSEGGWNGRYPSVQAVLYILLPVLIMATLHAFARRSDERRLERSRKTSKSKRKA
ncbi:lantibiotic ABC transporter permease [Candidatus Saccharibacteria bacterium]|nr:MAG: lantibiotic ABC transporter permease [Candidatus Saccharibacteria bacterium]